MEVSIVKIAEDTGYKPSSGGKPEKRFIIETEKFRWVVMVSRYLISESGTPVYKAVAEEEGHCALRAYCKRGGERHSRDHEDGAFGGAGNEAVVR